MSLYMHASCMHACVHTYMHAYIRTYIHTYVHTYIHTSIYTCLTWIWRLCHSAAQERQMLPLVSPSGMSLGMAWTQTVMPCLVGMDGTIGVNMMPFLPYQPEPHWRGWFKQWHLGTGSWRIRSAWFALQLVFKKWLDVCPTFFCFRIFIWIAIQLVLKCQKTYMFTSPWLTLKAATKTWRSSFSTGAWSIVSCLG